jgi:hypothetical protein
VATTSATNHDVAPLETGHGSLSSNRPVGCRRSSGSRALNFGPSYPISASAAVDRMRNRERPGFTTCRRRKLRGISASGSRFLEDFSQWSGWSSRIAFEIVIRRSDKLDPAQAATAGVRVPKDTTMHMAFRICRMNSVVNAVPEELFAGEGFAGPSGILGFEVG